MILKDFEPNIIQLAKPAGSAHYYLCLNDRNAALTAVRQRLEERRRRLAVIIGGAPPHFYRRRRRDFIVGGGGGDRALKQPLNSQCRRR